MREDWKEAQNRVKREIERTMRTTKTVVGRPFVDTYAARGETVMAQPSDFWVLADGDYFVLEVKSCHQDRFPFKDVRPSQWQHARMVPAAKGYSVFLIVRLPEWSWHFVSGSRLCALKDAGAKSMSWAEMMRVDLVLEDVLCRAKNN